MAEIEDKCHHHHQQKARENLSFESQRRTLVLKTAGPKHSVGWLREGWRVQVVGGSKHFLDEHCGMDLCSWCPHRRPQDWFEEEGLSWAVFSYCLGCSLALGWGHLHNYHPSVIQGIPSRHIFQYCFLCSLILACHIAKVKTVPLPFIFPSLAPCGGKWWMPGLAFRHIQGTACLRLYRPSLWNGKRCLLRSQRHMFLELLSPHASLAVGGASSKSEPGVARLWKHSGGSPGRLFPVSGLQCHPSRVTSRRRASSLTLLTARAFCLPGLRSMLGAFQWWTLLALPFACLFLIFMVVKYTEHKTDHLGISRVLRG